MAVDPIETSVDEPTEATSGATAVAEKSMSKNSKKLSASALIQEFEGAQLKSDLPEIYVGDTVRVGVRISEGNKERVQPYEGVVIAKRHGSLNQTITKDVKKACASWSSDLKKTTWEKEQCIF